MGEPLPWIFGYGSLIWRPAFAFEERRPARIPDYARRFWQGSPDHRGTRAAPGRVVTLAAEAGAWCGGMAYRVSAPAWDAVLAQLDDRESGGFERVGVPVVFDDAPAVAGLTYVAPEANGNFLGPAEPEEIATQVCRSRGMSGTNTEYVLRLAEALRDLGERDAHVETVAALVERYGGTS
ncbi:MAG: gamma-glutamylcyclotransferase [Myxococcota bacterium]